MERKEIAKEYQEPFYKLRKDIIDSLFNSEYRYTLAIYILFMDRAKYTKYIDEKGESYFIYSIEEIQKKFGGIKQKRHILNSIEELEKKNLIITKKEKGKATKFYLVTGTQKVPLPVP